MIDEIKKYPKSSQVNYKFCVIIPSWNNIEYLKLCIKCIQMNSHFNLQIIVTINEGNDGTLDWIEGQNEIDYIHAKSNIGICYGLNIARSLIKSEYIIYANDDMYMLPNWDLELDNEIKRIGHKSLMLSSTLIEPKETGNKCIIVKDYGDEIQNFNEQLLLNEYSQLYINDWNGSTWPPTVVHIDMWDLVGGLSIEFSPGMYSDPDFSRKFFEAGVRLFQGKGNSLVYHFGSKSTKRVKKNKGRKTFILKWGMTSRTFTNEYLKKGEGFSGEITNPKLSSMNLLINKLKRIISCW